MLTRRNELSGEKILICPSASYSFFTGTLPLIINMDINYNTLPLPNYQ